MNGTNTTTTAVREQLSLVTVGHVDHGKSTVVGRLLADTGSLPDGKLEQVKAMCARNARPFEYAFLLDALKNEQAQGITIDAARCFFKTARRDYLLNDAPGHIEFLKNMVTGAARAEAALLVIEAREGIRENSRRHGYILSMLGVSQVAVLVNKMDLVDFSQEAFEAIRDEYGRFLEQLGVRPSSFIPVSAVRGDNIVTRSTEMPWYKGPTVIEQAESFVKPPPKRDLLFRMPVQDIYKFTEDGDDRRIVAGTVATGELRVGDDVVFHPSGKRSTVQSIECFNGAVRSSVDAGHATGFTLSTQIYIKAGELVCRADQPSPRVGTQFRANLFWMGRAPMVQGQSYKLKLAAARVEVRLAKIISVLDASELSTVQGKQQIERHDVAECILETARPIAFSLRNELEETGRFVIVDHSDIAGCGIILEQISGDASINTQHVQRREYTWEKGLVSPEQRQQRNKHAGKFLVVVGGDKADKHGFARAMERALFERGFNTYYLGMGNLFDELDQEQRLRSVSHDEHIRQLGELARIMADAGLLFITTLAGVDDFDIQALRLFSQPQQLFVVNIGESIFGGLQPDVQINDGVPAEDGIGLVIAELTAREVLTDYCI